MPDYMLIDSVHYALQYDSWYFVDRPMTYYVERPIDIILMFDTISYSKGRHPQGKKIEGFF